MWRQGAAAFVRHRLQIPPISHVHQIATSWFRDWNSGQLMVWCPRSRVQRHLQSNSSSLGVRCPILSLRLVLALQHCFFFVGSCHHLPQATARYPPIFNKKAQPNPRHMPHKPSTLHRRHPKRTIETHVQSVTTKQPLLRKVCRQNSTERSAPTSTTASHEHHVWQRRDHYSGSLPSRPFAPQTLPLSPSNKKTTQSKLHNLHATRCPSSAPGGTMRTKGTIDFSNLVFSCRCRSVSRVKNTTYCSSSLQLGALRMQMGSPSYCSHGTAATGQPAPSNPFPSPCVSRSPDACPRVRWQHDAANNYQAEILDSTL
jgi:hypothetical protein